MAVTNLNGAKINLTTQMTEYANHLATKDYDMEAMTKNQTYPGENKDP